MLVSRKGGLERWLLCSFGGLTAISNGIQCPLPVCRHTCRVPTYIKERKGIHFLTFLNFSICFKVSGSSSWDASFIHSRAPLYSVRARSIRLMVIKVSETALWLNVATSCLRRDRGVHKANLIVERYRSEDCTSINKILDTSQHVFTMMMSHKHA